VASFDNPHNICEWARGQDLPWGNVPDAPIAACPGLPPNHAIPPYEPQAIRAIQSGAPPIYPMMNSGAGEWRRYRNAYYRLIEKVDAEIATLLAALDESGRRENTLIVFTSDHGDGHGAHRWNQKSILYEECVRVPLIVSYAGIGQHGPRDDRHLVSNGLDLLPTLCDYAGIGVPADLPGASLRPLLEGAPDPAWREELVVEAWPFQGDPGRTLGRMLSTPRYKYVVYGWGRCREQLFDLDSDPGEMVNLAVSTRYRSILRDHRERLRDYCRQAQDEFLPCIPAGDPHTQPAPSDAAQHA
jgi:arylsulfatase A-like enzyme